MGFLSPSPKPLQVKQIRELSPAVRHVEDVVTGAPQQAVRVLGDSLAAAGYLHYKLQAPTIRAHEIGDTGSTSALIFAERGPFDAHRAHSIARAVGLVLAILGLVFLVISLEHLSTLLSDPTDLIVGFVLLFLAAVFLGTHSFESDLVTIDVSGEVYKSILGAERKTDVSAANTGRASLVSELRLVFGASRIRSRNLGEARVITRLSRSPENERDLIRIVTRFKRVALPKITLQQSNEFGAASRAPENAPEGRESPPRPRSEQVGLDPPDEVTCGTCGQTYIKGSRENCLNCGGPLQ